MSPPAFRVMITMRGMPCPRSIIVLVVWLNKLFKPVILLCITVAYLMSIQILQWKNCCSFILFVLNNLNHFTCRLWLAFKLNFNLSGALHFSSYILICDLSLTDKYQKDRRHRPCTPEQQWGFMGQLQLVMLLLQPIAFNCSCMCF